MKKAICMCCGIEGVINKHGDAKKFRCSSCYKLWRRIRNRRKFFGKGTTVDDLIKWFNSQEKKCIECGSMENPTFDRIIPQNKGGLYETSNLQILCYTCNCCKKIGNNTVAEGIKDTKERECKICKKIFPLNSVFFHKMSYKPKYRKISKSMFHNVCKKCRLKLLAKNLYINAKKENRKININRVDLKYRKLYKSIMS